MEGYLGFFWDAVATGVIPKPELMKWNRFQTWRSKEGGGPKGVRGKEEQQRESRLWRAAMEEFYGADWWDQLYSSKLAATDEGVALGQEARKLFPDVPCTSMGSGPAVAPKSSGMMRRVNVLLENLDSYEEHHDRIARLCEIGQKMYPDSFTAQTVQVAKAKVNLMRSAFYAIADADDGIPPGRDHPDVGNTLMEQFLARFEQDFEPEYFSPGARGIVEAYDELLHYYDQPSANTLLQWNREAAQRPSGRNPPERRGQPGSGAAHGVSAGRKGVTAP